MWLKFFLLEQKPIDILHFHSSQGQEISMSALKQEKIIF